MEFYRVLDIVKRNIGTNGVLEDIRLHKIWLQDASGHARYIAGSIDGIESNFLYEVQDFEIRFDNLFKKAYELDIMLEKTGLDDGGIDYFNQEVEKIEGLKTTCKVYTTGTFKPLSPNHMIREEKYYIYRVKLFNNYT